MSYAIVREAPVLDHGFIRLVDHMGGDLSVVRAARVSHDAAWRAGEDEGSDAKLIRYLWANQHSTPFEAVELQFEVMAPIFVLRQWHRHRTWTYNELSARYRELPEMFYVPRVEDVGKQSTANKQGRQAALGPQDLELIGEDVGVYYRACTFGFQTYKRLLNNGWPRELARACLPLSTYSHMFGKVNLWNALRFATLRSDKHAQWEVRQYSEAMEKIIAPLVPVTMEVFRRDRTTLARVRQAMHLHRDSLEEFLDGVGL